MEKADFEFIPEEGKVIYSQEPQLCPIKYSVGRFDEDLTSFRELIYPFLCRDFFSEILYGNTFKTNVPPVYRFEFNYEKMGWKDTPNIIIHKGSLDKSYWKKLKNNLHLINDVEVLLGFDVSEFYEVDDYCFIVFFDPRIAESLPMFSLWSGLFRAVPRATDLLSSITMLNSTDEFIYKRLETLRGIRFSDKFLHVFGEYCRKNDLFGGANPDMYQNLEKDFYNLHGRFGFYSMICTPAYFPEFKKLLDNKEFV